MFSEFMDFTHVCFFQDQVCVFKDGIYQAQVDVNPDMTHLIIDSWLHLRIFDSQESQKALILANWLRYAWETVVEDQLQVIYALLVLN